MDFKDFCDTEIKVEKENTYRQKISESDIKKEAEKAFSQYKNMSNDELFNELLKQTNQKMQDGSLNNEKLDQIKSTLKGILPQENTKNLDELFSKLKK